MADQSSRKLAPDVEQWLATLAADPRMAASLGATIVPTVATVAPDPQPADARGAQTDSGMRAAALLHEVAGLSPTSTAQLRQGEVIAEGGMGVIRAAYQVSVGRGVAVKSLRPERRGAQGAIALLREAWITGVVEHPNVVPVHYVGLDDDGEPVIVLKRVEGVEWSKLLADHDEVRRRFGTTDLLAWNLGILMQLLNALRFAHSRGIVHRDLKPSNVMIGEFGEVYLLDWGIAVSLRADELGRLPLAAHATEMAGTPVYMAPEMLGRTEGAPLSERTDVYLAGAVLFELIVGRPPHAGSTALAVISSVALSRPNLPADVPTELAQICIRAMQADPADRFATADDMRTALVSYLEHRGSTRLLALANERLARLLELLARPRETSPDDDEIYRLFGACRFGFHEALAAWRDNTAATIGLVTATSAVAEYELAVGDPRAALALLSDLAEPSADLMARARRAVAEQAARAQEAEHLRREHDVRIGTRTRTVIMGVLGVLFTVIPLAKALLPERFPSAYAMWFTWSVGFVVLIAGFGIWARQSLTATILNRRAFLTVQALFLAQLLLFSAGIRLDIPIITAEVLVMLVWVVFSAMVGIALDRRLLPGVLPYLIAFVITLRVPEYRFFLMSAANFAYALVAVVQWWPARAP